MSLSRSPDRRRSFSRSPDRNRGSFGRRSSYSRSRSPERRISGKKSVVLLKPVRNVLFSLGDDDVDEEYLDIIGRQISSAVSRARRRGGVVLVVVGAQREHYRYTIVASTLVCRLLIVSCSQLRTVLRRLSRDERNFVDFADDSLDTWGTFGIRRTPPGHRGDPRLTRLVVTNGLVLPPEGLRIDLVVGMGVPIVGRPDAAKLMRAWCDYLDLVRPSGDREFSVDLWVETACGPEIAGMMVGLCSRCLCCHGLCHVISTRDGHFTWSVPKGPRSRSLLA